MANGLSTRSTVQSAMLAGIEHLSDVKGDRFFRRLMLFGWLSGYLDESAAKRLEQFLDGATPSTPE